MYKRGCGLKGRMLGRLEHRSVGCTHHENWTVSRDDRCTWAAPPGMWVKVDSQQFITLHRNGSASINRIYSRTFDPYEIYDEFKCVKALTCRGLWLTTKASEQLCQSADTCTRRPPPARRADHRYRRVVS